MFDLSILSDFQKHSKIFMVLDKGIESKWEVKYGYRHKLKKSNGITWNTFRIFSERNSITEQSMYVSGSICFLYSDTKLDRSDPSLTELECFQVFCGLSLQHCSSCCRAQVVWLAPTSLVESYMSVTASRNSTGSWRKACWKVLNILMCAIAIYS